MWPMAMSPGSLARTSSVKISETRPMPLMLARCCAVGGGDAGRFLAAMLEGVEAEIGLAGGVGMAVDGDYAAFFVELVDRLRRREWTVDSGQWCSWPVVSATPSTPW